MSINGHKQKKREWLQYRDFVLSPYGVIKIKSLGYMWQKIQLIVIKVMSLGYNRDYLWRGTDKRQSSNRR
ncbi:hypothetical protein [Symbiopectobacterium sp. RP]|uniref:hypothetical protein n=1 Tax=Symbiopectobacterium sp. RP TaxID=3248553 RepID=UPI003D2A88B7